MPNEQVKTKHAHLVAQIRQHDTAYYIEAKPTISDSAYDKLMDELLQLEAKNPELITCSSPSQRVAGTVSREFEKKNHAQPMLSLDKFFNPDELESKLKKAEEAVGYTAAAKECRWVVEPKVDGASLDLCYEYGVLTQALTRGTGAIGEDITANARTIPTIPLELTGCKTWPKIHIRGEVFMTFDDFRTYNAGMAAKGLDQMSNPRNGAAGSLRQLDSTEVAKRPLRFVPYAVLGSPSSPTYTGDKMYLKLWGFTGLDQTECKTAEEVLDTVMKFEATRKKLPFPTDGAVIKLNNYADRKRLGEGTRAPNWAWAYKYAADQEQTKLLDITVQVGRTGTLCPVGELQPVDLAGTIISRVSLHNWDELKRKDIRIGDTVVIQRAGDVIPQLVSVVTAQRTGAEMPFPDPVCCPACGGDVRKKEVEDGEGVAWICPNAGCSGRLMGQLEHFCSREAQNIEDIGPETIRALVMDARIKSPADFYDLSREQLVTYTGSDAIGTKIWENIQASKGNGMECVMIGLGIPRVGKTLTRRIARKVASLEALFEVADCIESLIPDFGKVNAESLKTWCKTANNWCLIEHFKKAGVDLTSKSFNPQSASGGSLTGKTFVFTGTIGLDRDVASRMVEDRGGRVTGSVSKKTSFVVVGMEPGSKLEKAQQLNIPILDEERFLELVK